MPSNAPAREGPQGATVLRRPSQVLIVGRKRSGKSTLLSSLLARDSRSSPRVLIADPHREHGEHAVEVTCPEDVEGYLDTAGDRWRLAYFSERLSVMDRKGAIPEFAYLCRFAREAGDLLFVVEEAHWFCTSSLVPVEFELLIKNAGHYGVALWVTTQRPQDIHGLLKSEVDEVYVLNIADVGALEWLRKFDRRVTAEQVQTLQQGQAYRLDLSGNRTEPARLIDTRTLQEISSIRRKDEPHEPPEGPVAQVDGPLPSSASRPSETEGGANRETEG